MFRMPLCFLFFGVGCLILQPIALKIGRRPVYLMGSISDIIGNAIVATGTTIGSLQANSILCGFGTAPVDSLIQISITDIFSYMIDIDQNYCSICLIIVKDKYLLIVVQSDKVTALDFQTETTNIRIEKKRRRWR